MAYFRASFLPLEQGPRPRKTPYTALARFGPQPRQKKARTANSEVPAVFRWTGGLLGTQNWLNGTWVTKCNQRNLLPNLEWEILNEKKTCPSGGGTATHNTTGAPCGRSTRRAKRARVRARKALSARGNGAAADPAKSPGPRECRDERRTTSSLRTIRGAAASLPRPPSPLSATAAAAP